MPADVGEEELQAVRRARHLGRRLERRASTAAFSASASAAAAAPCADGRADLEADPLELAGELLDLLLVQVELERERLQLRRLEVAAFLRALDERASLVGFEQFVELVLRQGYSIPSNRAW